MILLTEFKAQMQLVNLTNLRIKIQLAIKTTIFELCNIFSVNFLSHGYFFFRKPSGEKGVSSPEIFCGFSYFSCHG